MISQDMCKIYALISGVNQNGSQPNDQASEEMQICILLILKGRNPLPAWRHLHFIRRACTRMFQKCLRNIFYSTPW